MQIVFGVLGLGLVVFIHEAGHFLAARAMGIEVEVFSLGWGKKLIGFTRGGTEYRLSIFPLGGFVKMKGETAYQKAIERDNDSIETEKGSFFNAAPWRRIIVAAAGPFMNLIFALLTLAIIQLAGYSYGSFSNRVILSTDYPQYLGIEASQVPAVEAGIQSGDRILSLNGVATGNFYKIQQEVSSKALERVNLEIERDGKIIGAHAKLMLNPDTGVGMLGIYPWIDPVIESPLENSAGLLLPEDRILAVNGKEVSHSYDIRSALDSLPLSRTELTTTLLVSRGGEVVEIEHPLVWDSEAKMLFLGYNYRQQKYREVASTFFDALVRGWKEIVDTLAMTFKGLRLMFTGLNPLSALSGPIKITMVVGEVTAQGMAQSVEAGLRAFFHLLSLLSVALFFGNLLPIPVLDGGQILVYTVELIKRSPIKPRTFFKYQTIGAVIVFILFAFVLFGDLLFVFSS